MRIDVLTLFPEMFPGYLNSSILSRAQDAGFLYIRLHNIRDYAEGRHRITDEPPYGGGGGMVLKPQPLFAATEAVLEDNDEMPVILLTPQGRPLTQRVVQELAAQDSSALGIPLHPDVSMLFISNMVSELTPYGPGIISFHARRDLNCDVCGNRPRRR